MDINTRVQIIPSYNPVENTGSIRLEIEIPFNEETFCEADAQARAVLALADPGLILSLRDLLLAHYKAEKQRTFPPRSVWDFEPEDQERILREMNESMNGEFLQLPPAKAR